MNDAGAKQSLRDRNPRLLEISSPHSFGAKLERNWPSRHRFFGKGSIARSVLECSSPLELFFLVDRIVAEVKSAPLNAALTRRDATGSTLSLKLKEIFHDLPAALRQNTFRMKLHAPDRQRLVLHSHDFALLGFRRDLQTIRQRTAFDDERMIARRGKRIGHVLE
jgi:hypothetical protein